MNYSTDELRSRIQVAAATLITTNPEKFELLSADHYSPEQYRYVWYAAMADFMANSAADFQNDELVAEFKDQARSFRRQAANA